MGTCPPPCDSSQNGVCAEHGGMTRCWAIRSLRELRNLLDDCDRVRFIPDTGELTPGAVQELLEAMGGFRLEELADGVMEIRRRGGSKR